MGPPPLHVPPPMLQAALHAVNLEVKVEPFTIDLISPASPPTLVKAEEQSYYAPVSGENESALQNAFQSPRLGVGIAPCVTSAHWKRSPIDNKSAILYGLCTEEYPYKSLAEEEAKLKECNHVLLEYPLLVVERNPKTGYATWVACKLCPLYGSEKRAHSYIYACRWPVCATQMQRMLRHMREHKETWSTFCNANAQYRKTMLNDYALPPLHVFIHRVAQLKWNMGDRSEQVTAILKTNKANNGENRRRKKRKLAASSKKGKGADRIARAVARAARAAARADNEVLVHCYVRESSRQQQATERAERAARRAAQKRKWERDEEEGWTIFKQR